MEIEHEKKLPTGDKVSAGGKMHTGSKNLSRVKRYARTPGGANLGEGVMRNGDWCLKHKDGNRYEELSPETVVECISGRKVDRIIYMPTETELVAGK